MSKRLDLTGKRFGRLTVIKATRLVFNRVRNGFKEFRQEYECMCDCGNIKLTTCSQLKSVLNGKGTSSCGCAMRKDKDNWPVAFNMVWKNYVCHAASNNRNFQLTKDEFKTITQNDCQYCGISPMTTQTSKNKKNSDTYIYNGIDRVNNDIGYILSNCASCCEICNRMKLSMGLDAFLKHIERIYNKSINNSSKKL